jgi:hypothetical protein
VTAKPGEAPAAEATACARQLTIHAAAGRVLGAIATPGGLRRWWTTVVTGSAVPGRTLRFGFAGLDEQIVMHAGAVRRSPPSRGPVWHTPGTTNGPCSAVRSGLAGRWPQACELNFGHTGIARVLVAEGREHFLASPAACAEHGTGSPYGA